MGLWGRVKTKRVHLQTLTIFSISATSNWLRSWFLRTVTSLSSTTHSPRRFRGFLPAMVYEWDVNGGGAQGETYSCRKKSMLDVWFVTTNDVQHNEFTHLSCSHHPPDPRPRCSILFLTWLKCIFVWIHEWDVNGEHKARHIRVAKSQCLMCDLSQRMMCDRDGLKCIFVWIHEWDVNGEHKARHFRVAKSQCLMCDLSQRMMCNTMNLHTFLLRTTPLTRVHAAQYFFWLVLKVCEKQQKQQWPQNQSSHVHLTTEPPSVCSWHTKKRGYG